MLIANIYTLEVADMSHLHRAFPNVAFPPNPSEELLAKFGYAPLQEVAPPAGDLVTFSSRAERRADGKLYPVFNVRELSDKERRADYRVRVQAILDTAAHKAGFQDILDAVSYTEEPAPEAYRAKAQDFRLWRAVMWDAFESALSAYPKISFEELNSKLPRGPSYGDQDSNTE